MLIQINTDNNIKGSQEMEAYLANTIESTLKHLTTRITRVEVHLSDENSHKQGNNDKRCLLEARVKGMDPVTVSHRAENLDFAVNGATDKLKRALENTLGKLKD
jgi:ribosome-associated translation inhibitor RaiA